MRLNRIMNHYLQWEIKTCDYQQARELSQRVGISPLVAELLVQRGIATPEDADYFLNADLKDLQNPNSLTGIKPAVSRIREAIRRGEKIAVYGDYDVDGICSIVILKQCLERLGALVEYYVPDRFSEGYGINLQAVRKIADEGFRLLITVDCGITSVSELELANTMGLDVIISDHHTPAAELPPALAIINPKLGSTRELEDLCGAGVVFKLCQSLYSELGLNMIDSGWLELAAMATVADVVSLRGENRILVKYGLQRIPETGNCGLRALIKESGLTAKTISSWHIGFILAPRLNSAGRLQNARSSVELLLSQNEDKATELAALLCNLNNERKMIEETVYKDALLQVDREVNLEENSVLVLAGEGWHQGVTGIVASRLCEKYRRPAIVISWEGDRGRGSCRSLPGLSIYQALFACRNYLLQFGGHHAAAGLSIQKECFTQFRQAMDQWVKKNIDMEATIPRTLADAELEPDEVNETLLQDLRKLEPFGEGNPSPRFIIRGAKVEAANLLGKQNEHFKARLEPGGVEIIAFNKSEMIKYPLDTCLQDILFEPQENEFRGIKRIQLKLSEMKSSYLPDDKRALTEYGRSMLRAVHKGVAEINAGRPVVFIFPTYRSLAKHKLMLSGFLPAALLIEICGHINPLKRRSLMNEFAQGRNRMFLVTSAFSSYYSRNHRIPKNLQYVFTLYPEHLSKEIQEHYKECNVYSLQSECNPRILPGKADFDNKQRVLLYANRSTTLSTFAGTGRLSIEAGVIDIRKRKAIRRNFMQYGGILISDGASTGFAGLEATDAYFADAPYSCYETQMVMSQLAASQERNALILFERSGLQFNRNYLERCYPGTELLKGVLNYFRSKGYSPLTTSIEQLSSDIETYLQRNFKPADLVPVLDILADVGLCQFTKKGSIMAIKFIKSDNSTVNLRNSLYYMEGQAEKKEFSRWEKELNNALLW